MCAFCGVSHTLLSRPNPAGISTPFSFTVDSVEYIGGVFAHDVDNIRVLTASMIAPCVCVWCDNFTAQRTWEFSRIQEGTKNLEEMQLNTQYQATLKTSKKTSFKEQS